jgi:acetyltransferase-like isoleucine patch superfamily enzyme
MGDRLDTLFRDLQALHVRRRGEILQDFVRSVPLADELTDRWERARFLGFGEGSSIYDSCLVIGAVQVGVHTWIGPQTILDGSGGLSVGDYCSISAGVQLYSHDTVAWALSGGRRERTLAPTSVGNCCYLGPNVIVAKGVAIGNHCLIGANSLVNRSLPSNTIAVGTPARVRGRVEVGDDGEVRLLWDTDASARADDAGEKA